MKLVPKVRQECRSDQTDIKEYPQVKIRSSEQACLRSLENRRARLRFDTTEFWNKPICVRNRFVIDRCKIHGYEESGDGQNADEYSFRHRESLERFFVVL